jgi:hypothetical protein
MSVEHLNAPLIKPSAYLRRLADQMDKGEAVTFAFCIVNKEGEIVRSASSIPDYYYSLSGALLEMVVNLDDFIDENLSAC